MELKQADDFSSSIDPRLTRSGNGAETSNLEKLCDIRLGPEFATLGTNRRGLMREIPMENKEESDHVECLDNVEDLRAAGSNIGRKDSS